jgi:hypothetical protein
MKREPRNGLRPVTVKRIYEDEQKGYFHMFGQSGDNNDGIGLYAVVELENGKVIMPDADDIHFNDI